MAQAAPTKRVIFLHLSDIHFSSQDDDKFVFDAYAKIRHELEIDCAALHSRLGDFEGIIVTGDIAFSGDDGEYRTAYKWLRKLCKIVGCKDENVWLIPGNHDIRRKAFDDPVNNSVHKDLRASDRDAFDVLTQKFLANDGGKQTMYASLHNYLDFAKLFGCLPQKDQLFWEKDFLLNDRSVLRMRGLNSALVCDGTDDKDPFKMVLGEIQCIAPRDPGITYMYLTHHPPQWLTDEDEAEDNFRNHAKIQLMGHKHRQRLGVTYECVRLSAGAVNPNKREAKWEPRYNVLAVSVEGVNKNRRLRVDVYPRVWKEADEKFAPEYAKDGSEEHPHFVTLPAWDPPQDENLPLQSAIVPDSLGEEMAAVVENLGTPKGFPEKEFPVNLHRRITYRFLSLSHRVRLEIAMKFNLIRDEDEGTDDAELIRRIFQRARDSGVLSKLVKEVDDKFNNNG